MLNTDVGFPLSVTFEDGSVEQYESVEDLEQILRTSIPMSILAVGSRTVLADPFI